MKLDKENLFNKLFKCKFFKTEVNWLRYFLVSINHLSKFIPNAANPTDKLRPLSREENEKKNGKILKTPGRKNEWGRIIQKFSRKLKKQWPTSRN